MSAIACSAESLERIAIRWGARSAVAELRRTDRRKLKIEVKPTGEIWVYAPIDESTEVILCRVQRRASWIFRELDQIASRPAVTPPRRYVSGETHLFLGRQYRLAIEPSDEPSVQIRGRQLVIRARKIDDPSHCRRLLDAFYSIQAKSTFSARTMEVLPAFERKGLRQPKLVVRRMTKRWGSYTTAGTLVLNVDLVRADPISIDYVICHELAHAFFPDHGNGWRKLLDSVMPDWQRRKDLLERKLR